MEHRALNAERGISNITEQIIKQKSVLQLCIAKYTERC